MSTNKAGPKASAGGMPKPFYHEGLWNTEKNMSTANSAGMSTLAAKSSQTASDKTTAIAAVLFREYIWRKGHLSGKQSAALQTYVAKSRLYGYDLQLTYFCTWGLNALLQAQKYDVLFKPTLGHFLPRTTRSHWFGAATCIPQHL